MTDTPRLFLSKDAAALSVGADAVAAILPRDQLTRTGSRGLLWLEPLLERVVEVSTLLIYSFIR